MTFGSRLSEAMDGPRPAVRRHRPAPRAARRLGADRQRLRAGEVRDDRRRGASPGSPPWSSRSRRSSSGTARAGIAVLEKVVEGCRELGALVLLDVKRGDIGSTVQAYADAYLDPASPLAVDAVTASPYLGFGSLDPLVDTALANDAGVFVLALTSNPEGPQVQHAVTPDGRTVAGARARRGRHPQRRTPSGMGSIGAVVGATIGRRRHRTRGPRRQRAAAGARHRRPGRHRRRRPPDLRRRPAATCCPAARGEILGPAGPDKLSAACATTPSLPRRSRSALRLPPAERVLRSSHASACWARITRSGTCRTDACPTTTRSCGPASLPFAFPPFDRIRHEHYRPAFDAGVAEQRAEIEAIAATTRRADVRRTPWRPLERSGRTLERVLQRLLEPRQLDGRPTRCGTSRTELAPRVAAHYDEIRLDPRLFARRRRRPRRTADAGLDRRAGPGRRALPPGLRPGRCGARPTTSRRPAARR